MEFAETARSGLMTPAVTVGVFFFDPRPDVNHRGTNPMLKLLIVFETFQDQDAVRSFARPA